MMNNIILDYRVRSAQIDDLPRLGVIERAAARLFLDTPYAWLVDGEALPLDFVSDRFQAGQIWVAVDRLDLVVGFAIACDLDRGLYLKEIDVEPAHGNRGIGRMLIETVVDWAKFHGYDAVFLSTFRDVPWNAPFYSKLGFSIVEESKLTAGLQEIRQQEAAAGLPILDRVIMVSNLIG
jgi:GNAT superfamily N-acetyltransferase